MKHDIHQEITDRIIEQMETCGRDWIKPFTASHHMPVNASTHNQYNGINVLLLGMFSPYSSTEWASYKQWQGKGANVKKGEKGTRIVFFKMLEKESKGEVTKFPMMRYSTVFNAEQVEGYISAQPVDAIDTTEALANVDEYVKYSGATIDAGNIAAYWPDLDRITMPERSAFIDTPTGTSTEHYYSVLLHELTHWTGHKNREDRLTDKSKEGYAFEELVAELGAAYQCVELGIDSEPREDHAQYLASWLRALKGDKKFIFKAAARAQKAVNYIKALQPQLIDYVEAA